jgi:hypothetical protein
MYPVASRHIICCRFEWKDDEMMDTTMGYSSHRLGYVLTIDTATRFEREDDFSSFTF